MAPAPSGSDCAGLAQRVSALAELRTGLKQGLLLGAMVAVLLLPPAGPWQDRGAAPLAAATIEGVAVAPNQRAAHVLFEGASPSADARELAEWVATSGDSGGLAFAILDSA